MLVNMHEAKTHLSRLVDEVSKGNEVILGKAGRPVARLVPYVADQTPRRPGRWAGQVTISPDFDVTPDWLLDAFEGR
jgi:prevent-host-death family protein